MFAGLALMASAAVMAGQDFAFEESPNAGINIPIIGEKGEDDNWTKVPNVAQFHSADWSHVFGRANNVSLAQAKKIAESYPEITFFFHMTHGYCLNLGGDKIFYHNDAVFFTGEPYWGNATGYSDGYVRKQQN